MTSAVVVVYVLAGHRSVGSSVVLGVAAVLEVQWEVFGDE